jgi:hypothetical protein
VSIENKENIMRTSVLTILATLTIVPATLFAGRLKIYSYPKTIAPGQMATIIFENPDPEASIDRSSCTAEKLVAWVKQDVPILRIEQKGKMIFTSLGSYKTLGDSAMATFMVPPTLIEGDASLFILNDRDASVPYKFTVTPTAEVKILRVDGTVKPLQKFTVVGEGFMPSTMVDEAPVIKELDLNVGYSKMKPDEQFTLLNKRIQTDWDRVAIGNFLYINQSGKEWRVFVENCGMAPGGLALEFTLPPDVKPGTIGLTMMIRKDKTEYARSAPFTVSVE